MPKVILSFNLPKEKSEYRLAVHGGDWQAVVYEVNLMLRNALKHGHEYKTADQALEAVRDLLWNECTERKIDPWSD